MLDAGTELSSLPELSLPLGDDSVEPLLGDSDRALELTLGRRLLDVGESSEELAGDWPLERLASDWLDGLSGDALDDVVDDTPESDDATDEPDPALLEPPLCEADDTITDESADEPVDCELPDCPELTIELGGEPCESLEADLADALLPDLADTEDGGLLSPDDRLDCD